MPLLQKKPITYGLPGERFPFGTLIIKAYVKPAHTIHLDYFPTLVFDSLNFFCSEVNYSYTRIGDESANLIWECFLTDFWRDAQFYHILIKYLYQVFDYWELNINLTIPYTVGDLPSPFF